MFKQLAILAIVPISLAGAHAAVSLSAADSPCVTGAGSAAAAASTSGAAIGGTAAADVHTPSVPCSNSDVPDGQPSSSPSEQPTSAPSDQPTDSATDTPSDPPSDQPSDAATADPSAQPSDQPSDAATTEPSDQPAAGDAQVSLDAHASTQQLLTQATARRRAAQQRLVQELQASCDQAAARTGADHTLDGSASPGLWNMVSVQAQVHAFLAGSGTPGQICALSSRGIRP